MLRAHRITRIALPLVAALWSCDAAHAQDAAVRVNDFQTWVGMGLDYSPTKRIKLSAKYVCRNFGVFEMFKGSYYYLEARTRLNKHWSVDGLVRVMDSNTSNFFRLEGGVRYRIRHHHDTWYTRTAFFNERRQLIFGEEQYRPPTTFWRQRLFYSRDLTKKLRAELSAETWVHLNGPFVELDRAAFIGDLVYDLPHGWEASLGYLVQPEYAAAQPKTLYAVMANVDLDLDSVLKKKNKHRYHNSKYDEEGHEGER